jgi:tetratricopeptide (TPR) repeat protein
MTSPVLALALALAVAAPAQPLSPAEQAKERALDAWEAGRYEEARAEIERAYQLDPLRRYLFARARIEQADGHCDVANEFYRRYLAEKPPEVDAAAARRAIAECDRQLAAETQGSSPDVAPVSKPARPWHRDPLAIGLVTSGAVVLAVGLGLYGRAFVEQDKAESTTDYAEFDRRLRRAQVMSPIGIVGISVGAALVVGGAVRWAVVRRREKRADRISIGPRGIGIRF